MSTPPPLVSVIVPLFNAEAFIGRAVASLQDQTLPAWEAIVIDDGSTDRGADLVEAAARRDPRLRLRRTSNRGPSPARNAGLELATARYVLFLDADDWLVPRALARLVDAAEKAPSDAVCCGTSWHGPAGQPLGFSVSPSCAGVGLDEILEFNRFSIHAQLIRRDVLGESRFDPSLGAAEDHDLWLRLAERGVRWHAVHEELAAYRALPASRSRDYRRAFGATAEVINRCFARARAGAPAPSAIDLSEARRTRVLRRYALEFASSAVLRDASPDADSAAAVFGPTAVAGCLSTMDAAHAVLWSIPGADCAAPNAWRSPPGEYCRAAQRWWNRCAREGWGEPGFSPTAARRELARLSIDPARVAERLAERCEPKTPVVLLGFGQNARRLAPVLARRAFEVSARDATAPAHTRIVEGDGFALTLRNLHPPFDARATHIVTPCDDAAIIDSLPQGLPVLRWSVEQDALLDSADAVLRAAWNRAAPGSSEAPFGAAA